MKVYRGTLIGKLVMLIARKFMILSQNNLQIFVIVMAVFVPASLTYFWLGFNSSSSRSQRIPPGEIFILALMAILYYFFSFSYFGMLPLTERLTRIRYLLKMNGVKSIEYFGTMFMADSFISLIIVFFSVKIVQELSYDYVMYDESKIKLLVLSMWFWSLSFIVQSYCISYIFTNKSTAAKSLTFVLFGLNMLHFIIREKYDEDWNPKVQFLLDIFFTAYTNYERS